MPDAPAERFTRRRLLAGAGAGVVVLAGGGEVLANRSALKSDLKHWLGQCGKDGPVPPDGHAQRLTGTLPSGRLPGGVRWTVSLPRGHRRGEPIAVLFSLHGRGGHGSDPLDSTHLDDIAAQQRLPLAIAGFDAGDSYFHPRADGRDALGALLNDFVPFAERELGLGADGRGRAIHGISMGGYGAALAAESAPGTFGALVVSSGAIFRTRADQRGAVPDAFDSDADFARYDVIAGAGRLDGMPVRVDCGTGDPYHDADRAFARAVGPSCVATFPKGCHDGGFWRRVAPDQVAFVGRSLGLRPTAS